MRCMWMISRTISSGCCTTGSIFTGTRQFFSMSNSVWLAEVICAPLRCAALYSSANPFSSSASSASTKAIYRPPALDRPQLRAAETPLLGMCTTCARGSVRAKASRIAPVASVDPSSMKIISISGSRWTRRLSRQVLRYRSALKQGTITLISALAFIVSLRQGRK